MKSELRIRLRTPPLPPLHANTGPLNGPSMSTSWVRPDRIGPTGSASWDWNTAAKRVRLPSTISSNTMSASLKPACGRAAGSLSILTTSAGRWMISSAVLTGTPVSGIRITTGTVVVVVVDVVVDVVVLAARSSSWSPWWWWSSCCAAAVVVVVDSASPPDEQAASMATASATTDVR